MNKRNKVLFRVAVVSVSLLVLASIFIPVPWYLWVSLAVAVGVLGISSGVYSVVSGVQVSPLDAAAPPLDAARAAYQLGFLLLYNPELYIVNMPDYNQFVRGLLWLEHTGGPSVREFVKPRDAAPVAEQLLLFDPAKYTNMPYRNQFVRGLQWLANTERRGVKDLDLPVVKPGIEPVVNPRIDPVAVVVNPRTEPVAVTAEDGNPRMEHI